MMEMSTVRDFAMEIVPLMERISNMKEFYKIPEYVRMTFGDDGYINLEGSGLQNYKIIRYGKEEKWVISCRINENLLED